MSYTFGDSEEASLRLRRLAEVYEAETRTLFEFVRSLRGTEPVRIAVDLGSGPGWSTVLLYSTFNPLRTIGLEASDRYVAEASVNHPHLEFIQHDVLQRPFPVQEADLLTCRFLLTHLSSPTEALRGWAEMAACGALLAVHETEKLESSDPALRRYYEMVDEMQRHHGQELNVGAILDRCFEGSGWAVIHSESILLEKPARSMAALHLPNLRVWSKNEFVMQAFGSGEIAALDAALNQIASGREPTEPVRNTARQIVARRAAACLSPLARSGTARACRRDR